MRKGQADTHDRMKDLTGEELESIRKTLQRLIDSGLTQTQIARQIRVNPSTISNILSGRHGVRLSIAKRIAEAAGVEFPPTTKPPKGPKIPMALEEAIRFASVNGIPHSVVDEFVKGETGRGASPEDLYFEIRALYKKRSRKTR